MPDAASFTRTSPWLRRVELDLLDAPLLADLPQDRLPWSSRNPPGVALAARATLPGVASASTLAAWSLRVTIETACDRRAELAEAGELVEEELLVEEISIDGMCGVY